MAVRGVDLAVQGAVDPLGHPPRLVGVEEPVRVDCDHQGPRPHAAQGLALAAAVAPDVVGEHRAAQRHVGARVEAARQLLAVVVQVRLDGQPAAPQGVLVVLRDAAEALVQLGGGAVGGVGDLAGQGEAPGGADGERVVVAPAPVRVELDGADLRVGPGGLLRGGPRARGDDHEALDAVGAGDRPLDGALPAQGGADDEGPGAHSEQVGQPGLGAHLVAGGHDGEAGAPGRPVRRRRGRARGSLAAAQDVRGDHEAVFGVDRLAGADDGLPPARGVLARRGGAQDVGVAGERVQDQDRVGLRLVEPAPCLVGDAH